MELQRLHALLRWSGDPLWHSCEVRASGAKGWEEFGSRNPELRVEGFRLFGWRFKVWP